MGRLIYGYWDCPYCKSKGIRGDNRECPNCGRPRDESIKFYMGANIEYVPTDKTTDINRNPDWLCPFCESLNSDSISECVGCGAPRGADNKTYFDLHKPEKEIIDSLTVINNEETKGTSSIHKAKESAKHKKIGSKAKIALILTAIAIPIIVLLTFLLSTHQETLRVTGFSWSRLITVEKLTTVNESDWDLPFDARLQYSKEEIRSYQNVLDHYETETRQVEKQRISGYEEYVSGYRDLGNGMFEEIASERPIYETYYETETYQEPVYRQEPVYATKYYYEIDKWLAERTIRTKGTDKNPVWGEVNLVVNERTGSKKETYTLHLQSESDKSYTYDVPLSLWQELSENDTVVAEISRLGIIMKLSTVE